MNETDKKADADRLSDLKPLLCAVPRNCLNCGDYIKYRAKDGMEDIAKLNDKYALEFRSVFTNKGEINKRDIITILEPQGT